MVLDYIKTTDGCISHIFPSCPVHKEWVLPLHASCWQVRRARRRDESSALGQQRPGIGSGVGLASLFHVTSSARRDWPQYPSTLYSLTVLTQIQASWSSCFPTPRWPCTCQKQSHATPVSGPELKGWAVSLPVPETLQY